MKHTVTLKSESMPASRLQKQLRKDMMNQAKSAIDQLLRANPEVHEGKVSVELKSSQMSSTENEGVLDILLKVRYTK